MGFGVWEIVLILVIVLIIFGAGKLPEVADSLGKGVKSFKSAVSAPDEPVKPGDDKDKA